MEPRRRRETERARDQVGLVQGVETDERIAEPVERLPVRGREEVERVGARAAHRLLVERHELARCGCRPRGEPAALRLAHDVAVLAVHAGEEVGVGLEPPADLSASSSRWTPRARGGSRGAGGSGRRWSTTPLLAAHASYAGQKRPGRRVLADRTRDRRSRTGSVGRRARLLPQDRGEGTRRRRRGAGAAGRLEERTSALDVGAAVVGVGRPSSSKARPRRPRRPPRELARWRARARSMLSVSSTGSGSGRPSCVNVQARMRAVEPERPVVDVPGVELEALLPGDLVAAVDLRPARDARASRRAAAVVLGRSWRPARAGRGAGRRATSRRAARSRAAAARRGSCGAGSGRCA